MAWAPDIPLEYVEVGGNKFRFIRSGAGPIVVLLHTLRTQLDLFEKVVPELSKHFTIYALDYPGHGYSDIPKACYNMTPLSSLTRSKASSKSSTFAMSLSLGFLSAGRSHSSSPPGKGRGMARSSFLGWLITYASLIPVIGEKVMRLRNFIIMKAALRGGVADSKSIPPVLLKEMYVVGSRQGHYRAFISLLRNAESWEAATKDYGRISVPVLLIWGDRD